MRLLKHNIDKNNAGSVTLQPEEPEDMWHAYNLIRPTDLLRAQVMRRVKIESSDTGSAKSTRVLATVTIRVKSVDFDSQASALHVAGQIVSETIVAKMGQYQTVDLELNRQFELSKVGEDGEGWDSMSLEALNEAIKPEKGSEGIAVVMTEGLANICAITPYRTVLLQRVEQNIPQKSATSTLHDTALNKFFAVILSTVERHLPNPLVPILLCSPGFTAQAFQKYIYERMDTKKSLAPLKPFLVISHVSSPHIYSLKEALSSPALRSRLADTRFAKESAIMDKFFKYLRTCESRAWYGPKEVDKAVDAGAVGPGGGALLISNRLFRATSVPERKRWVTLVEKVKEGGGEVRVFSSDHESGKRLEGLGGIAAILTYPLEDLDEDEESIDGGTTIS
ncbi:MAG: Translation factor pelota [Cirrosporium novae-zelandiae]|nr:MAG: Translation factor pelota [Cirrosporium novae-zelandiae]